MVLIIVGAIGALALCILLFCKAKKVEGNLDYRLRIPFCILLVLLCVLFTNVGMAAGLLDRNFGNLAQAFHDNGLPYCFMNSVLNTGMEKPDNYSEETMGALFEEFEEVKTPEARFARAMDHIQPVILNDAAGGISWKEHDVHGASEPHRNKGWRGGTGQRNPG